MKAITDMKLAGKMSAGMNKIVSLTKQVRVHEQSLNYQRIMLALEIYDWTKIATESETLKTNHEAAEFISQKTKMSVFTIGSYYRVGKMIEVEGMDPNAVNFNAVFQVTAYAGVMSPATKLAAINVANKGGLGHAVRRLIYNDRKVRASMTHNRINAQVDAGTLSMDHLKIELLAAQTYANRLTGKKCIITVTDQDYVPICEVGAPRKVKA